MHPRKRGERIVFAVGIVKKLALSIGVVRIEWNLVEIAPGLRDKAQLIRRIQVVNQRREPAKSVRGIVNHRGGWRLQSEIGPISIDAGVIRKAVGVPAEIELVVALIEIPRTQNQLGFIVALEAGARSHVEDSIRPVAIIRRVTA